jgi:acetyl-CoA acetyltransferase
VGDEFGHRDKCAIVGIGETDISRNSGRSDLTMATQAALAAIADAGLKPSDIDGLVRCDMDTVSPYGIADSLGLTNLTYWSDVPRGGAAAAAMVGQAAAAVISGMASHVLVFRELNGRSGRRLGQSLMESVTAGGSGTYEEYFAPYGMVTAGQQFAMIAQRHMIEFGTTSTQLGRIAMAVRARANANPSALMHDRPMTMDDYLASRMIASPLRMFDFCLETDNAGAVVVTSADRARDLPHPPALIRAVAQGAMPHPQPIDYGAVLRESMTELPARAVAQTLFSRAGMGPEDIDVAQFYDCYTITILLQLEDYGFCKKGEGGPFVESGAIDDGGHLPLNTDGGNLSYGYIHGMNHVIEGTRQLRGTSTSQVLDAQTCLVTSTPYSPGSAMILRAAA